MEQEETLWRQNSQIIWINGGEKNTKFFHDWMIQHRHHNRITHLQSYHGHNLTKHEDIQAKLISC